MRSFGWHNFYEEVRLFHAQLKQFLSEPEKERDRTKQQALSMKRYLEDNVLSPTTEEE